MCTDGGEYTIILVVCPVSRWLQEENETMYFLAVIKQIFVKRVTFESMERLLRNFVLETLWRLYCVSIKVRRSEPFGCF